jgi:hypothetical protein
MLFSHSEEPVKTNFILLCCVLIDWWAQNTQNPFNLTFESNVPNAFNLAL